MMIVDRKSTFGPRATPSSHQRRKPFSKDRPRFCVDRTKQASIGAFIFIPVCGDPDTNELAVEACARSLIVRYSLVGLSRSARRPAPDRYLEETDTSNGLGLRFYFMTASASLPTDGTLVGVWQATERGRSVRSLLPPRIPSCRGWQIAERHPYLNWLSIIWGFRGAATVLDR